MTEKEKMLSGKGYYANDELLVKEREYRGIKRFLSR